jgi:hypothetical protein
MRIIKGLRVILQGQLLPVLFVQEVGVKGPTPLIRFLRTVNRAILQEDVIRNVVHMEVGIDDESDGGKMEASFLHGLSQQMGLVGHSRVHNDVVPPVGNQG